MFLKLSILEWGRSTYMKNKVLNTKVVKNKSIMKIQKNCQD